jgi:hypothetical protein
MSKHINNIGVLKDFLSVNNINHNDAGAGVKGYFEITTPENSVTVSATIRIRFDAGTYREGSVDVICDLPVEKYPTTFLAAYQDMSVVDNELLMITGNHPEIGTYKAILSL